MGSAERITADVCVIGGGPAGSTTAHRLASFGYQVCLLERETFPEARSGASLPSSILPLLEVIGVRERMEHAGFLRPERIVVWWSERTSFGRSLPGLPGFHVDRSQFDDMLLRTPRPRGSCPAAGLAMRPQRLRSGGWQIPCPACRKPKRTHRVIHRRCDRQPGPLTWTASSNFSAVALPLRSLAIT